MLSRRALLNTVAATSTAVFAGCSRTAVGQDPPSVTPAPLPPRDTAEPAPEISLALDVQLMEQFTPDHPASLRVSVTNTDNVPLLLNAGRELPLLSFTGSHTSTDAEIALVPQGGGIHVIAYDTEGKTPPVEPVNGCWRLNGSVFIPGGVVRQELPPSRSITQTYTIYAHRNNSDDCLPAGTYRFLEVKPVKKRPRPAMMPAERQPWSSVILEFSVTVGAGFSVSLGSDSE